MLAIQRLRALFKTALMPHGLSIGNPYLTIASSGFMRFGSRPFRLDEVVCFMWQILRLPVARGFVRGNNCNSKR